jgi:predicted PhzF superfamily epimerase YddE/YHI9
LFPAAIVDAFTTMPFAGNPAGLVLLDVAGEAQNPTWMQAVAREIGVSETGFLVPRGVGRYGLRWFTPAVEVELCGHATLAAAHWLWETGERAQALHFDTASGPLSASRDDRDTLIWLDFPIVPVVDEHPPPCWCDAFPGATLEWVGRTAAPRELERNALLVTDAATLRELAPDLARVAALPCGGVIVTARSDSADADVLTRYFAPACGIDEDPVTGSAHCTVGWYWAPILASNTLHARQVSARGGELRIEMDRDRVRLGGYAVTIARLELVA